MRRKDRRDELEYYRKEEWESLEDIRMNGGTVENNFCIQGAGKNGMNRAGAPRTDELSCRLTVLGTSYHLVVCSVSFGQVSSGGSNGDFNRRRAFTRFCLKASSTWSP